MNTAVQLELERSLVDAVHHARACQRRDTALSLAMILEGVRRNHRVDLVRPAHPTATLPYTQSDSSQK